jgi:DNA topoisomerase IB
MARLHRSDPGAPGWTRRRRGRGFQLLGRNGRPITDPESRLRVSALVIPPAWRDVWINPDPLGHIQATGVDDAGRLQYRYHDGWHEHRSTLKFDAMLAFARRLPPVRERVAEDIEIEGLHRDRVLAVAVRLLDIGFFRIGCETYARSNGTYGLATMRREHVSMRGDVLTFDYAAKHGRRQVRHVIDPATVDLVRRLKRARHGHDELFGWRTADGWRPLRSGDVNAYLKEVTGSDADSAKGFRTWNATVLAAVAVAVAGEVADTVSGRKRAIARATQEVATYLGNTPAVCRSSYIDPRVFDHYVAGRTIERAVTTLTEPGDNALSAVQGRAERAVLSLLSG